MKIGSSVLSLIRAVLTDLRERRVWLLNADKTPVGTVTIDGNEIKRLFVLPSYQGKGWGSALMSLAESLVLKTYNVVELDASLPAYQMYEHRGYRTIDFRKILCDNEDWLCYHRMAYERREERG